MRRASKESWPACEITISPSITNFLALSEARLAASSGKYRVSGLADFDISSTLSPCRNARQRKPSHLGSYCHWGPTGSSVAESASMGAYDLLSGKGMGRAKVGCG